MALTVGTLNFLGVFNINSGYVYTNNVNVPVVTYQGKSYVAIDQPTEGLTPDVDTAWNLWEPTPVATYVNYSVLPSTSTNGTVALVQTSTANNLAGIYLYTNKWNYIGLVADNSSLTSSSGVLAISPTTLATINGAAQLTALAKVSTSGSYTDLSNTPAPYTLPAATVSTLGGVMTPLAGAITNTAGSLAVAVDGTTIKIVGNKLTSTSVGGITSINSDTTPAQQIKGAGSTVVNTVSGITTITTPVLPNQNTTNIQGSNMKGSGGVSTALTFTNGANSVNIACFDLRVNTQLDWFVSTQDVYTAANTVQVSGVMTMLGCSALTGTLNITGSYALYAVGATTMPKIDTGTISFSVVGGQVTTYTITTKTVATTVATSQFILEISGITGVASNGQIGLTQTVITPIKMS